ncbi:MAG: PAS domain-containing protein [Pseudomonadota bacterium]
MTVKTFKSSQDERSDTKRQKTDIVSIFDYRENLRYPVLEELEAYWEGLRGSRKLPKRSEIDPRDIQDTLEYAFIGERIAPGIARLRLAGMHLNELLGMEVRGMPLTAFIEPGSRRALSDALDEVFEGPEVVTLTLETAYSVGKPALDAKLVLMPLLSDFGEVSRVLGGLQSHGVMGRVPRRFDIAHIERRALTASESSPEHALAAQAQIMAQPNSAAIEAAAPSRTAEHGHLRLLSFD